MLDNVWLYFETGIHRQWIKNTRKETMSVKLRRHTGIECGLLTWNKMID